MRKKHALIKLYPVTGILTPNGGSENINEFIANALNTLNWFVGVAALVGIVYGGLLYLTSGGDSDKLSKAKKALLWSIAGIIIITLAQVIVALLGNTINNEFF